MKFVILINNNLTKGIAANTCAVIGMTLGKLVPEVIGKNLVDKNKNVHPGITSKPVPVLKSNEDVIKKIYLEIQNRNSKTIITVPFSQTAQRSKNYKDYANALSVQKTSEIIFNGLGIYGKKEIIEEYTKELKLFFGVFTC